MIKIDLDRLVDFSPILFTPDAVHFSERCDWLQVEQPMPIGPEIRPFA